MSQLLQWIGDRGIELARSILSPGPGMLLFFGMLLLLVALLILTRTHWGQAKPISKCIVLSLFAHLVLLGYACCTRLMFSVPPGATTEPVVVALVEDAMLDDSAGGQPLANLALWDKSTADEATPPPVDVPRPPPEPATEKPPIPPVEPFATDTHIEPAVAAEIPADAIQGPAPSATPPTTAHEVEVEQRPSESIEIQRVRRQDPEELSAPRMLDVQRATDVSESTSATSDLTLGEITDAHPSNRTPQVASLPQPESSGPAAQIRQQQMPRPGDVASSLNWRMTGASPSVDAAAASRVTPLELARLAEGRRRLSDGKVIEPTYGLRSPDGRRAAAMASGGSPQSEEAVDLALAWLAGAQASDGRWDASRFGSGQERRVLGHDRGGAGADADTGISGLALLAMLGAGHTHLEGPYKVNVDAGLAFLVRSQHPDGSLAGEARIFARMYCHAMALLALSEAYAMTGDAALQPSIARAIDYSVRSQNRFDGGWRYQPGDRGDMSQFGWQVMALKSAQLGGLSVPESTFTDMNRFLSACATGAYGGLASYRPQEQVTPTMTAEALVCRSFLQAQVDRRTAQEASELISRQLPGDGQVNLYYWYYATLALHQVQTPQWSAWNQRLTSILVNSQNRAGSLAGSWNPDCIWAGYGGRVYSTAMSALCLEVYYRYLPVYGAGR